MLRHSLRRSLFSNLLLVGFAGGLVETNAAAESSRFAIPPSNDGLPGEGPIRRYDWFQKLWESKRSRWANQVEQDQGALAFLGDSITQGWGPNMGNAFPGVKVANRGISGDTTRGMLIRLDEDVLSLNPSGVVMLMGTNDLEELAKPTTIAANVKRIVAKLKAHNDEMPIVLCNVFPSSTSKKRSAADIQKVNRLYADAVHGDPQVAVLDTWTLFANKEGDAKRREFPDLLHPNKLGYRKWAAALRPVLATLGYLDRDADAFQIESGYTSLFNGYDLDGWMVRPSTEKDKASSANWRKNNPNAPPWPIITAPQKYDDKVATADGRYIAKNGRLVVTIPPEGRKIQQFWTQKEFPNDFVLKLEFRATPNADSGIFIRGKQLQCRDFPLAGPYKELKHFRSGDWNEVTIVVRGNSARYTCNGEVLETDFQVPDTGPIGLEADRGQVEYRRIRFREISPDLSRTSPEQQGLSSAGVLNLVNALDQIDAVHSFMLLRHGFVVAEGWWTPFERNDPHQLYSLSKSFTSTAVGLAISEGKLSLDDTVVSLFPDDLPETVSNKLASMRVRDLLSMSTGHVSSDLREFSFQSDSILTKDFLALPVKHAPGTHFLYNTPATYMCAAIVQKVTGEKLIDYLTPRLFEPLGIQGATWSESPQQIAHGGYGLNVRTEDIARFGQVYLDGGQWQGRQIVPTSWVRIATAKQTSNGSHPENDWNQGYGFQFWRCRNNCYRGDGAFGQFCIVMPDQDAVLAITSGTANMGSVLQQVWDHLLPEMHDDPLPLDQDATDELEKRLTTLKLPIVTGKTRSPSRTGRKRFNLDTNEQGLTAVTFEFGDRPKVTFETTSDQFAVPMGGGLWQRNRIPSLGPLMNRGPNASDVAIASHAAWPDAKTWQARIWLVESPYRLDVQSEFDNNKVDITVKQNVSFGPKGFKLTGTAEPAK